MPRWWLLILYATIVFSIGYCIAYPAWPLLDRATAGVLGWTSQGALRDELAAETKRKAPILAALARAGISPVLLEAVRRGAKSVGFHLPAYYSPQGWFSWGQCAELYEEGKLDPNKLQIYDNTVRGIAHKKASDAPEAQRLWERRESYPIGIVPSPRALFLTAGVDIQKNRIEWEIVAWGRGKESWSIDTDVISGSIVEPQVAHALDEVLARAVPCGDGGEPLLIRVLGIDSGYDSENVYAWARRHIQPAYGAAGASCRSPHTVAVLKGKDTGPRLVWSTTRDDLGGKRGLRIFQVSGYHFAMELYTFLRLDVLTDEDVAHGIVSRPGYAHFPEYNLEYFKQLTADKCVITMVRGRPRETFVLPKGARNEAHDCRKYARAAAELYGLGRFNDYHWRHLEEQRGIRYAEEQRILPLDAKVDRPTPADATPPRTALPPRPMAPAPLVGEPTLVDAHTGWEIAFRAGDGR